MGRLGGVRNGVWRLFGDWLDAVWGLEAVCWRLVAGFVRSGGPRGEVPRGVPASGDGLWAGWGEVGGGYGSLLIYVSQPGRPPLGGAGGCGIRLGYHVNLKHVAKA